MEIPPLQCDVEKVEEWSSVFRRLRRCCRLNPPGKGVDDTENMRTSSSNPSSTVNSEDASDLVSAMRQSGEHSSCATDSVDRFSGNTETDAEHQEDPEAR